MVRSGAGFGVLTAIVVLVIIGHHYQKLIKPTKRNSTRRSCLSSDKKNKTKKKVHFASDVVEARDGSGEYRGRWTPAKTDQRPLGKHAVLQSFEKAEQNIPANRVALYSGILRFRAQQASLYY
ncbi:hypothetical protein SUGI_0629460 [Cryptomeria japonica]|uniref:uncharacterized protein LOC131044163 n=1 Tax=Cryptomeria japonica TaxID=3369 RepID=UPI002414AB58|nr:uncharacterized protein LOC131044163 [Cryptomeria japonica]GLJ31366.1 hypothetical protein SUGI_0629460 [Cryptomeria japonica]